MAASSITRPAICHKSSDASAEPGDSVAFANTGILAVHNDGWDTVSATDRWWGADEGPSGAGPGSGDAVSTDVDYGGFKSAANGCLTLSISAITAAAVVITDIVPVSATNASVVSAADATIEQQASTRYVWDVAGLGWRKGRPLWLLAVAISLAGLCWDMPGPSSTVLYALARPAALDKTPSPCYTSGCLEDPQRQRCLSSPGEIPRSRRAEPSDVPAVQAKRGAGRLRGRAANS